MRTKLTTTASNSPRSGGQAPDMPPQAVRLDRPTPAPTRRLSRHRRVCGHSASSLGHWPAIIFEDSGEVLQISARAADARVRCFPCEIVRLVNEDLLRIERGERGFWLVAAAPEDVWDDIARQMLLDRLRALVAPAVSGWPDDVPPSGTDESEGGDAP